jgi:hypothetical protein
MFLSCARTAAPVRDSRNITTEVNGNRGCIELLLALICFFAFEQSTQFNYVSQITKVSRLSWRLVSGGRSGAAPAM